MCPSETRSKSLETETVTIMPKEKKRLSKSAKAALKAINESKLLTAAKAANATNAGQEFRAAQITPRTSAANKPRPEKKKG